MLTYGRRWLIGVHLLSFIDSLCVTAAFASRQGSLDAAFGSGGLALALVPDFSPNGPRDILVQPDGKIVVVGGSLTPWNGVISLARFNADGSPDTGFGSGGLVITELSD